MPQTAQGQGKQQELGVLYVGIELGGGSWRIACRNGRTDKVREVQLTAGDTAGLLKAFDLAKARLRLTPCSGVHACYEAGRDGFWLHRWLVKSGIKNKVLNASSIQVTREMRRCKTDRLDARSLVVALIRYERGETEACREVIVPSDEQEDIRRDSRERERLKEEESRHLVRMQSLLALHGVRTKRLSTTDFDAFPDHEGKLLPPRLRLELKHEQERLRLVRKQLAELERARTQRIKTHLQDSRSHSTTESSSLARVLDLSMLRGIGRTSAWVLSDEFFYRQFKNAKNVGSGAGFANSPFDSGLSDRDQGISKAGSKRVRTLMVEIAWSWLRYQPQSELSQWFNRRFGVGKRIRKIGIVALARRLLVTLWRYLNKGIVPEGALLKDEIAIEA